MADQRHGQHRVGTSWYSEKELQRLQKLAMEGDFEAKKVLHREDVRSGRMQYKSRTPTPLAYSPQRRLCGYTQAALDALAEYSYDLGALLSVWCDRDSTHISWTTFIGSKQSVRVCGFGWGYGGAGPMGFVEALGWFWDNPTVQDARRRIVKETRDHWVLVPRRSNV